MRSGAGRWGLVWVLGWVLCLFRWIGMSPYPLILSFVCFWSLGVADCARDRPWQAYPITILTGAYIGYALGMLLGQVKGLHGKRVEFAPAPEVVDAEQEADEKAQAQ